MVPSIVSKFPIYRNIHSRSIGMSTFDVSYPKFRYIEISTFDVSCLTWFVLRYLVRSPHCFIFFRGLNKELPFIIHRTCTSCSGEVLYDVICINSSYQPLWDIAWKVLIYIGILYFRCIVSNAFRSPIPSFGSVGYRYTASAAFLPSYIELSIYRVERSDLSELL